MATMQQVVNDAAELYENAKTAAWFSTEDDVQILHSKAEDLAGLINDVLDNEAWVDDEEDEDEED